MDAQNSFIDKEKLESLVKAGFGKFGYDDGFILFMPIGYNYIRADTMEELIQKAHRKLVVMDCI